MVGSPNDRRENLIIVDLLRNNLSRICVPSSVHVPMQIKVESYVHEHRLASAVRGELRSGRTAAIR